MSTQPPVEFEQWRVDLYEQAFTMALGANAIYLPGYNREASLNPGAAPGALTPTTRAGRRWLSLGFRLSVGVTAGDNIYLGIIQGGNDHIIVYVLGDTNTNAGAQMPLIRGAYQRWNGNGLAGLQSSIWVPDPISLFITAESQIAGTVMTVTGAFIETLDRAKIPPDSWL